MAWLIPVVVVAIGFLLNVAAFVWATVEGRWLLAAPVVVGSVVILILAARALGSQEPLIYGFLLGFTLFFAAMMLMLGVIAWLIELAGRRE